MRKLLNEELDRLTVGEYKESKKIPVMVVLDNIRSQNNIGSVFRTADAFRMEGILLCGITATPPHREIHKTALGATESVNWEYREKTTDATLDLKKKGYQILAVEQRFKSRFHCQRAAAEPDDRAEHPNNRRPFHDDSFLKKT